MQVALQKQKSRPVGDLLVSLIDPVNWSHVRSVTSSKTDAPGVLADAFGAAPPLNIVFAEAVTIDSGTRHEANLICEPFHLNPALKKDLVADEVRGEFERLSKKLSDADFQTAVMPLHADRIPLIWEWRALLQAGWARDTRWRSVITERHPGVEKHVDLNVAVISADTTKRLLRFVFPRHHARTVRVQHADRPGAMEDIVSALAAQGFNILSLLNRRGSAPAGMAEIVAQVEPSEGLIGIKTKQVDRRLDKARRSLKPSRQPRWFVEFPQHPDSVIYPLEPGAIVARPDPSLEPSIRYQRRALDGRQGVFISHRFLEYEDPRAKRILETVKALVSDEGFAPIEALGQPGDTAATSENVKAKMWAATAAIMLVMSTTDERELSMNIAHELGFMQGQGKRLLPLVERGLEGKLHVHANFQGMQLSFFARDHALERDERDSIEATLRPWLKSIKRPPHVRQES